MMSVEKILRSVRQFIKAKEESKDETVVVEKIPKFQNGKETVVI